MLWLVSAWAVPAKHPVDTAWEAAQVEMEWVWGTRAITPEREAEHTAWLAERTARCGSGATADRACLARTTTERTAALARLPRQDLPMHHPGMMQAEGQRIQAEERRREALDRELSRLGVPDETIRSANAAYEGLVAADGAAFDSGGQGGALNAIGHRGRSHGRRVDLYMRDAWPAMDLTAADRALNARWAELKSAPSDRLLTAMDRLLPAQRAWIPWRDAECATFDHLGPPDDRAATVEACKAQLTVWRTADLGGLLLPE